MKRGRGRHRLAADSLMIAVWRYERGGLKLPDAIRAARGNGHLSPRSAEYRRVKANYRSWKEKWESDLEAYALTPLDQRRPGRPLADETPLVLPPPVQLRGQVIITEAATAADIKALFRLLGVPVRRRFR
jgi:hypothetical protein